MASYWHPYGSSARLEALDTSHIHLPLELMEQLTAVILILCLDGHYRGMRPTLYQWFSQVFTESRGMRRLRNLGIYSRLVCSSGHRLLYPFHSILTLSAQLSPTIPLHLNQTCVPAERVIETTGEKGSLLSISVPAQTVKVWQRCKELKTVESVGQ